MAGEISKAHLISELTKFGQAGDYVRALKAANKILHHFQDDEKVFHCKIISLLHLSKYDEAVQAFTKFKDLSAKLIFERAYCYYRLNRTEESLKILEEDDNNDNVQLKELKAQIFYKLERYKESYDLYTDILRNVCDDYDEERMANYAAVMANMINSGFEVQLQDASDTETYEVVYNKACQLIAQKQYGEADQKLKLAETICRNSFDDDQPQEEIEEEIIFIKLQQAYCLQMQGRNKEAQSMYTQILKQKPNDMALIAVASNNSAAINNDQNLFDSKKKIKTALSDGAQKKITSQQKKIVDINNCLLNIYLNQHEQALQQIDSISKKYNDCSSFATLIKAGILVKDNKKNKAIELLKANSTNDLNIKLAMTQIFLESGQLEETCSILEQLGDNTYRPGIVSALVTIYLEQGKRENASKILEKAVAWLKDNSKATSSENLRELWRQAAELHLRGGQPQIAAQSLEQLLNLDPHDMVTLAQLIMAYARYDANKAIEASRKLPKSTDLAGDGDISTLEATNWIMGLKAIKKANKGIESTPLPGTPGTADSKAKTKKKAKRKGKLPKNYNVDIPPDPERWLPKHERSTFRKKKDRRAERREIGKGTQGAAGSSAEQQYDMSNRTASTVPSQPSPRTQTNQQHKQSRVTPLQQKKKKKSGKR